DDAAFLLLLARGRSTRTTGLRRRRSASAVLSGDAAGGLVHDLRDAVRLLLEALADALDGVVVLLLDRLAPFLDERLEGRQVGARQLVLVLVHRLFERVAEVVELVPALDDLAPLLVLGLVLRGLLDHALDVRLVEAGVRRDRDLLVLAGR